MFIAKNNDLIILVNEDKNALEQQLQDSFMNYTEIVETEIKYELYEGEYLTQEEIENKKQKKFEKEFFNTSLGYVRRKVHMMTGEVKSFLFDILPILQVGTTIITYKEDGTQNTNVYVTEEFINECKMQVLTDFYGK